MVCGQAEDELESLRSKHQKQVNAMSKQSKELAACQEEVEKWKAEAQKSSDAASRRMEDRDASFQD